MTELEDLYLRAYVAWLQQGDSNLAYDSFVKVFYPFADPDGNPTYLHH